MPGRCDLFIVGCGPAACAAAFFAARKGLDVVQAGNNATMAFASGLLDVLGNDPLSGQPVDQPWRAVHALREHCPEHPYARMDSGQARRAMEEILAWLAAQGLAYCHADNDNSSILTPLGSLKRSWAAPDTFWPGIEALKKRAPALLVDFAGLREYSARQICSLAHAYWPQLRAQRLDFPAPLPRPLAPLGMARAMELAATRKQIVREVQKHLGNAACIGLPAILGTHRQGDIRAELESALGLPVFELPTLPPSVPGFRLQQALSSRLEREGVTQRMHSRALRVRLEGDSFRVGLGAKEVEEEIRTRGLVLATGRFAGGGLVAEPSGLIREALMNLHVRQPEEREQWHSPDFFDPAGHPLNRAGLVTDAFFRPLDAKGVLTHERLFAIGSLLAGQDWMREQSGSGLAIAGAKAAVDAYARWAND
jgi:glycerol-3-phosphate dehydrogenase subunit B